MIKATKHKITIWKVSFIFIFIAGCGALNKEKFFKSEKLIVSYRSFNRLGENYHFINPDHPAKITKNEIEAQLKALDYKSFKARSKVTRVFSKNQIKEVSSLLTKGLRRANEHSFLHFELKTAKGKTEGDVFSADGNIHWRIWKIKGVDFSNDPFGIRKKTWRLIPRPKGHRYFISTSPAGPKKNKNWLVAKFNILKNKLKEKTKKNYSNLKPQSKPNLYPKNKNFRKSKELDKSIKEKLILLKQLFEQGLINESEFDKKKKEVINRL